MAIVTPAKLEANRKNALLAGRPKGAIEDTTLYKKLFVKYVLDRLVKEQDAIITAMLKKAIEGDVTAFTALRDTAVGKPVQAVEHGGTDGQPIVFMPLALIQKHSLQIDDNVSQTQQPLHIDAKVVQSDTIDVQKDTQ